MLPLKTDLAELAADAVNEFLQPLTANGSLIGYARVSTQDQNLLRQELALQRVGCKKIFADKLSGKNTQRPQLIELMKYVRPGDVVVVVELSRFGRSLKDLIELVEQLRANGIGFKSLKEHIDTTTAGGRLVFHIFAALAEFIREMIIDGTNDGLAAARASGKRLGRPPALSPEQIAMAGTLVTAGVNIVTIAEQFGVSRSTLYTHVPELRGIGETIEASDPRVIDGNIVDPGQLESAAGRPS